MELNNIANDLELEIIKIGRVLGPRWVACSVRAVSYTHLDVYKRQELGSIQ